MTDSPFSRQLMDSDWKGSKVKGNSFAGAEAEEEGGGGGRGT